LNVQRRHRSCALPSVRWPNQAASDAPSPKKNAEDSAFYNFHDCLFSQNFFHSFYFPQTNTPTASELIFDLIREKEDGGWRF
jgi:hypothetical protein